MIVTIDGPAGAGKSSAARRLAQRLGFRFLDTGAMYRAVTLAALRQGIDWQDRAALQRIAKELRIELTDDRVFADGIDVTAAIRTSEITTLTLHAADNQAVRETLGQRQRELADGVDVVTEGRDQATLVFPDADCKIYLTASENQRAQRRHADLIARGERVEFDHVLRQQQLRDERDVAREFGGLTKTADSIEVCTDDMTPEQVVDQLEQIVRAAVAGRRC
ncbi:MAG: (d)CMP kinase [Planctomycetota bacterium]